MPPADLMRDMINEFKSMQTLNRFFACYLRMLAKGKQPTNPQQTDVDTIEWPYKKDTQMQEIRIRGRLLAFGGAAQIILQQRLKKIKQQITGFSLVCLQNLASETSGKQA